MTDRDKDPGIPGDAALHAEVERLQLENAELQIAVASLRNMINTDRLTGLASETALLDEFDRRIGSGARTAVIFWDAENFKEVNERGGYAAGNSALRRIAHQLRVAHRLEDVTHHRIGGDELVTLVSGDSLTEDVVEDIIQRGKDSVSDNFYVRSYNERLAALGATEKYLGIRAKYFICPSGEPTSFDDVLTRVGLKDKYAHLYDPTSRDIWEASSFVLDTEIRSEQAALEAAHPNRRSVD